MPDVYHSRPQGLAVRVKPERNREISPLHYDRVYQLKRDFPHLTMSSTVTFRWKKKIPLAYGWRARQGVAYQNPGILAFVDREIFAATTEDTDPVTGVRAMYPYIERELSKGTYLGHVTRHMSGCFRGSLGLVSGVADLSENAHKAGADINVLEHALKLVADKR